uniref:Leucine-rich repeat flightless-interacting protein 2-like n=1 Tax=Callorhinchus milii TaxID=7868 RepID=A0A4W3H405_CALMI
MLTTVSFSYRLILLLNSLSLSVLQKYYGLDTKWGDIEQWMEDSERYSRRFRRLPSVSDEDERMSVGSRGSLRSDHESAGVYGGAGQAPEKTKKKKKSKATNGYDELSYTSGPSKKSSRSSRYSDENLRPSKMSSRTDALGSYHFDISQHTPGLSSKSHSSSHNGSRASLYEEGAYSGNRRCSASSSRAPSEYSCFLGSGSRASSRASSARASPVVEERPEKDFGEKGSRTTSSLSAATLASLGGTSSRRGSGDTIASVDTEASIREIKDIFELKDQIQDVEGKYMQSLKELKDSLAEVEEKYRKAMVSNAQLDNEKNTLMYQVDTLQDVLLEVEEHLAESNREFQEKAKELEREKHAHSVLQFQFEEIKESLKQREEMLMEIKRLTHSKETSAREISDLQETIEWKDKKIGALERQKEYFDTIRSERDELKDMVVMLKEKIKAHGLVVSEVLNGDGGREGDSHTDPAEVASRDAAPQLPNCPDGPLGKTQEMEMRNEILENVGRKGVFQNAGNDAEQMEKTGDEEVIMDNVEGKEKQTGGHEKQYFRLRKLLDERDVLLEQVKKLKAQIDDKTKNGKVDNVMSDDAILQNGTDLQMIEVQRDANRQVSEYKFKLAKSEQEIIALEQNIIRLESQVLRYKGSAENAEKVEDDLKAEKRKLQREVRSALDKIEELEMSNSHLVKRLEKKKANRSALLSQQ